MATANIAFDKLQIALEATKGDLAVPVREIPCLTVPDEQIDFYRSPYATGKRGPRGGAGVITHKGMLLPIETELTAEELMWFLETGVLGAVAPTIGTGDYTRVYAPELTTAVPTIKTGSIKVIRSDGVTNHYYAGFGYAMTQQLEIDWAVGQVAKLKATMFGRARQTGTPTAALAAYTDREPLVAELATTSLDTTWAGLGVTQLSGIITQGKFSLVTGYTPDVKTDGRADKDFTKHKVGDPLTSFELTAELDAPAASRIANYRANDIVFIRQKFVGTAVGLLVRTVQIDMALRFKSAPKFSENGPEIMVGLSLEGADDVTSGKTFEITTINGKATVV